jgi:hypothetical protein
MHKFFEYVFIYTYVNCFSVPLTSISVDLTINGFIANVQSILHFKNTESSPIEAVYEFPLDDQSAVYQFEAQIEDRVIVAECQPKKEVITAV